jgi:hypothetical protein
VLDARSAQGAAARAALDAAAGGGALWFDLPRPPFGAPRLDSRLAELLDEQIRRPLAAPRPDGPAP